MAHTLLRVDGFVKVMWCACVCVRLYDEKTHNKLVKVLAGKETNEGVQTALVICNVLIILETH